MGIGRASLDGRCFRGFFGEDPFVVRVDCRVLGRLAEEVRRVPHEELVDGIAVGDEDAEGVLARASGAAGALRGRGTAGRGDGAVLLALAVADDLMCEVEQDGVERILECGHPDTVGGIERRGADWILSDHANAELGRFDGVVLALPPAQAAVPTERA